MLLYNPLVFSFSLRKIGNAQASWGCCKYPREAVKIFRTLLDPTHLYASCDPFKLLKNPSKYREGHCAFSKGVGALQWLRRLRGFVHRLEWVGTITVLRVPQMTIFGIREISKRGSLAFTSSYVTLPIWTLCSWALSSCRAASVVPDKQLCAGASWITRKEKESRDFWNVRPGYWNNVSKPKDLRTKTREAKAETTGPCPRAKETVIWTLGGVEAARKWGKVGLLTCRAGNSQLKD